MTWGRHDRCLVLFVFVFVFAFVAVVASRVSARRPTFLLCLAKERRQRKATPVSASPGCLAAPRGNLRCSGCGGKCSNSPLRGSDSRTSCWCPHNFSAQSERTPAARAPNPCAPRRIHRGGGPDGPSPRLRGGRPPTARCACLRLDSRLRGNDAFEADADIAATAVIMGKAVIPAQAGILFGSSSRSLDRSVIPAQAGIQEMCACQHAAHRSNDSAPTPKTTRTRPQAVLTPKPLWPRRGAQRRAARVSGGPLTLRSKVMRTPTGSATV
jgi:hypothetical protein